MDGMSTCDQSLNHIMAVQNPCCSDGVTACESILPDDALVGISHHSKNGGSVCSSETPHLSDHIGNASSHSVVALANINMCTPESPGSLKSAVEYATSSNKACMVGCCNRHA